MSPDHAEYIALTAGAGFVDCSDRTQIEITGDDRAAFLHNLTTAAIKSLQPGQGCEAFALDVRGHTLGHFLVFCTPHSLIIDSAPGQNERLAAHFEKYHIRERIEIHDRTAAMGRIAVVGRESANSSRLDLGSAIFPSEPLSHREARIAEQTVWLRNVEITGSGGVLISATKESIARDCRRAPGGRGRAMRRRGDGNGADRSGLADLRHRHQRQESAARSRSQCPGDQFYQGLLFGPGNRRPHRRPWAM